jgi:hypothetical protein
MVDNALILQGMIALSFIYTLFILVLLGLYFIDEIKDENIQRGSRRIFAEFRVILLSLSIFYQIWFTGYFVQVSFEYCMLLVRVEVISYVLLRVITLLFYVFRYRGLSGSDYAKQLSIIFIGILSVAFLGGIFQTWFLTVRYDSQTGICTKFLNDRGFLGYLVFWVLAAGSSVYLFYSFLHILTDHGQGIPEVERSMKTVINRAKRSYYTSFTISAITDIWFMFVTFLYIDSGVPDTVSRNLVNFLFITDIAVNAWSVVYTYNKYSTMWTVCCRNKKQPVKEEAFLALADSSKSKQAELLQFK